ncbi:basic leucine zipper 6-like [Rhodamnia argentea]|uniref:Basic leucine zipper 6-like n=1 Tax=Rhodamnia argentea TaxID=178133 RepID=A0A8B8QRI3_9MYRT|nr:basic leucine zipper 6-like [Rhodamnia argentea]
MAQPPPHVSHLIPPNWPPFPHHPGAGGGGGGGGQPSWVDEFLEFSSTRRGAHRRSASDSVAFLEAGEYRNSAHHDGGYGFDRLDDEQLMSMFSEDGSMTVTVALPPPASSSGTSTPSDQNSNTGEIKPAPAYLDRAMQQQPPKTEPGTLEVESDSAKAAQASSNADATDPKRVKRILANRQSAQRSRVRKLQYISELERSVNALQSEVSALSPRVAFFDHQRLILTVDNSALKQRIAALAQDKIFKDAHQEALKKEIERLRRVYQQQNLKKMADATPTANPSPPPQDPPEGSDNDGSKG